MKFHGCQNDKDKFDLLDLNYNLPMLKSTIKFKCSHFAV